MIETIESQAIIRLADIADIPRAEHLLQEFHEETFRDYGLNIDMNIARDTMRQYVTTSWVLEQGNEIVGVLAGYIIISPLDHSQQFREVIWYVSKRHRSLGLKLLRFVESYCKNKGITHIIMVHMCGNNSEKIKRFYVLNKYRPFEVQYIKILR